jgi:putative DNA primase/helicase
VNTDREPDAGAISAFVHALFRHADDGSFVSLRAFNQFNDGIPPPYNVGVQINGQDLGPIIAAAVAGARYAANHSDALVFAPPIATFRTARGAAEADLINGVCISVEIDAGGDTGSTRGRLEELLGPATVVVASGGEIIDTGTGEVFPKLHLHWRLSEPTRAPEEHAVLKHARWLACALVHADPTAKSAVHPLRWPGSWHLKAAPKLACIVALNEAAEVHLAEAVDALELAAEAVGLRHVGIGDARPSVSPQAPLPLVESALAAIPNDDEHWDFWIKIGLLTYAATGGSDPGRTAWIDWSRKSSKFVEGACEERWNHFHGSPPTKGGAGTLFFLAKAAGWIDPRTSSLVTDDSCSRGSGANPPRPPGPEPAITDDNNAVTKKEQSKSESQARDRATEQIANESGLVTEGNVADAFAREHRDELRYDHQAGSWYVWDRSRWNCDETKLAYRWAHEKARSLAAQTDNNKAILGAGRAAFAAGVERLAQAARIFAVTHDHWDQDQWLLGTPGGTIDLRTGELQPVRREDHISKQTAITPAETVDCPMWLEFLNEVTQGDEALISFLQRWFGYCLTGDTREHALLFVYGPGGNGKGVLMNTVFAILGDYAVNAAMDTFVATRGDKHTTDLAMLAGARLVMTTEVEEGREWAEARIKALTGGDPITARFMRYDNFTFYPRFKLTISGNHKPSIRNIDDAARRRFNIVPFLFKPSRVDKRLTENLKNEWPGILRWIVDGCVDWQRVGLNPPKVVTEATDIYFGEEDSIRHWIDESCETGSDRTDTTAALFKSWSGYAAASGEKPRSIKWLSRTLTKQGFKHVPEVSGHRKQRGFEGIRVKPLPTLFGSGAE